MNTVATYLFYIQGKIFKLLPMREDYDAGVDNYLYEYIDNLYSNYIGAFASFPGLRDEIRLIEVQNNIAFLRDVRNITFEKWRTIVLRSTRLIHSVFEEYVGEVQE